MSTALITGASGFIARHLARTLRETLGGRIVGIDLRPGQEAHLDQLRTLDLTDRTATTAAIETIAPGTIYHLVGLIRGADRAIYATNVTTTVNLLEAARQADPTCRIVLVGSAAEYGVVPLASQPVAESFVGEATTLYGAAKQQVTALAKEAAREWGQQVMVARPFNVIGPGVPDTLVAGAIVHRLRTALAGLPPRSIRIGRTSAVRDFVAVEDVAVGLVRVAHSGRAGECYNLCSGQGRSVAEVLDQLLAQVGEPVEIERDAAMLRTGDVDQMIGSPLKANRELGWEPVVSFEESVRGAWRESATG